MKGLQSVLLLAPHLGFQSCCNSPRAAAGSWVQIWMHQSQRDGFQSLAVSLCHHHYRSCWWSQLCMATARQGTLSVATTEREYIVLVRLVWCVGETKCWKLNVSYPTMLHVSLILHQGMFFIPLCNGCDCNPFLSLQCTYIIFSDLTSTMML